MCGIFPYTVDSIFDKQTKVIASHSGLSTESKMNCLRSAEREQNLSIERECVAYSSHINHILSQHSALRSTYLPIDSNNLLEKLRDGVLLGYLLDYYHPSSVDLKALKFNQDLSKIDCPQSKVLFEVNNNLNQVVRAAKSIDGLKVVNLGAEDILCCNRELVLGLLWQIINSKLVKKINLFSFPELVLLMEPGEELLAFSNQKPDTILIRWVNYHLKKSGCSLKLQNICTDLKDSLIYVNLLRVLLPEQVGDLDIKNMVDESDIVKRATCLIELLKGAGLEDFLSADSILSGHKQLNFVFLANLFNSHLGLRIPSEDEFNELHIKNSLLESELIGVKFEKGATEKELRSELQRCEDNVDRLQKTRDELSNELAGIKKDVEEKYSFLKQELIAHYQEELVMAVELERSRHSEQIWDISNSHREIQRRVQTCVAILFQELDPGERDAICCHTENLIETVSAMESVVTSASKKINMLKTLSVDLDCTVKHQEKVNEIMGSKIREYAEIAVSGKNEGKRRNSLLKKILSIGRKCQS